MKAFIGAMILLGLMLVGTSFYTRELTDTIGSLDALLVKLEENAGASNFENNKQILSAYNEEWDRAEKWIKACIDHKNLELINHTFSELEGYANANNKEETLVKTAVLRKLLSHIPENEKLSLENIF